MGTFRCWTVFVSVGLIAAAALPVAAQETPAASRPVDTTRIQTLDQALGLVVWNPARRGALLVVDPAGTRLFQPRPRPGAPATPPVPLPPLPPSGGYLLRDIAPCFGRGVIRVRTLSVLAPTEMTVLNARPGGGDPLAGLRTDEKLRLLMGTLNPAQWALLGGPRGLGAGDLGRDQQALFLSMLPDPFRVQKAILGRNGGYDLRGEDVPTTLTPAVRAATRLRLARSLAWSFMSADSPNSAYGFGRSDPRPEGTHVLLLRSDLGEYTGRDEAFGVMLRAELPNRLKPGHLDFDAPVFDALVSVEKAGTLGDLIRRTARATGVELYADPRAGSLPVWTRSEPGTGVRAGDLLKALALAVTGAFRRVGDARHAFVLTDDIEGIGTRRARLQEWAQEIQARKAEIEESVRQRLAARQPGEYIRFAQDDPFLPSPDLQRRIEAGGNVFSPSFDGSGTAAVGELPPAAQEMIRKQLELHPQVKSISEGTVRDVVLRTDRVRVEVQPRLSYVIPGMGEVRNQNLFLDLRSLFPQPPPSVSPTTPTLPSADPVVLPPEVATRALHVAPKTAAEAVQAAREAHRRGLNQLWVGMPEEGGKEILAAAIQSGKENGLAVVAVARLLRPSAASDRDRNILGETAGEYVARRLRSSAAQSNPWERSALLRSGDWLRIDAPAASALRKRRLLEIAATPDLAGLVLRDTAAPGYAAPAAELEDFVQNAQGLGYTPEMRLAFLRKEGMDPIDLDRTNQINGADLSLPFFSDRPSVMQLVNGQPPVTSRLGDLSQRWNGLRHDANVRFLTDLYKALRVEHPDVSGGLPLLIQDRPQVPGAFSLWYGSWDRPDALPHWKPLMVNQQQKPATLARSYSRRVLRSVFFYEPPSPPSPVPQPLAPKPTPAQFYARSLRGVLDRERRDWDGIVLDLGDQPFDQALALLEAVEPIP